MTRLAAPDPETFDAGQVGHFRLRRVAGKNLLTNDWGRWRFLSDDELASFVAGTLDKDSALYGALVRDGFVRNHLDFDGLAAVWRARHRSLWMGATLHTLELRRGARAMSAATAAKAVARAFESPAPELTLELAGDEPLAAWPLARSLVLEALGKSAATGKACRLRLVGAARGLDDSKLAFLLKHGVELRSPFDRRPETARALASACAEGLAVEAIVPVREAEGAPEKLVDELVDLGIKAFALEREAAPASAFLAVYRRVFERLLQLGKERSLAETTARDLLARIIGDAEPESACGPAVARRAYGVDGAVYAGAEALALGRAGDDSFKLGALARGAAAEAAAHPVVKALAVASCLDNQPDCSRCAYKPYDDVSPVQCYAEQGDIMGRMPTNGRCLARKGILDLIFEKLQDRNNEAIFRTWLAPKGEL